MRSQITVLLVTLLLITSLEAARAPERVSKAQQEATAFMKKKHWDAAIKVFERVNQVMEGHDYMDFQWYGWFIYHRGMSEYRSQRFNAAMASIERYYEKFGPKE